MLEVEIQDVQPLEEQPWGFTGVFDKNNGGGFLDEIYPNAYALISSLLIFWRRTNARHCCCIAPKRFGTLKASSAPAATFPA